ncbi:multicopper oxidase family protein [Pontibacillus sp. HMF3514]|uniref:multicopper oxidase family protein n=1 Tax=Pontibacillus sp. HMF3514 TaxID=2692425 RepID=UPI00131F7875|nr:multicopper oxidase family protein [Pontibacillus sp. HMF3514]QHE53492.1 multicopper oxidase domain-containing protein [Pontibacillus sp. HMF3514]
MKVKILIILGIFTALLVGCQENKSNNTPAVQDDISEVNSSPSKEEHSDQELTLTTSKVKWDFGNDIDGEAWTYNGSVPGKEIRLTEGQTLQAKLINKIDAPVTIHWHGMVLPNEMDGVPGVTQNAVMPGEDFTYTFKPKHSGTYWYHSHQQSSSQVDKGLYGPLIIEPKNKSYDQDKVFVLDEWLLNRNSQNGMGMGMGTHMGNMMSGDTGDMDTQMLYNTFTVNGKTSPDIPPAKFKSEERVRLRFINAGYQKHILSLSDQSYKVVALDAQPVKDTAPTTDLLEIAPGERIDIEFTSTDSEDWYIQSMDNDSAATDMRIPIQIDEADSNKAVAEIQNRHTVSQTFLESKDPLFNEDVNADKTYDMLLGAEMHRGRGLDFTINQEVFPKTPTLNINKDDIVKVTLSNDSQFDHPMHLHGHHFQIISKNGEKLDKPIVKDLINVKPNESYEIIFKADNPGDWVFHCHDLLHAENGMMSLIHYNGYTSPVNIHDETNKPE